MEQSRDSRSPGRAGRAALRLRAAQTAALHPERAPPRPPRRPAAGLAVEQTAEGDKVLGAVVLSYENQRCAGRWFAGICRGSLGGRRAGGAGLVGAALLAPLLAPPS